MARTPRPVGTEFWSEPWVDQCSSRSCRSRVLRRVVSHSRVGWFDGDGVGEAAEEVRAVRVQEAPVTGMTFAGEYLFGDWEDVG